MWSHDISYEVKRGFDYAGDREILVAGRLNLVAGLNGRKKYLEKELGGRKDGYGRTYETVDHKIFAPLSGTLAN